MSQSILLQLGVATLAIMAVVAIHGLGLALLSRALHSEDEAERAQHVAPLSVRGALVTLAAVMGLVTLHGIEIWLFAGVFLLVEALPTLESALYFSTITYGTVGYSDRYIDPAWRLIAGFEGIAGIILLGWSTAFFVRMIGRVR